MTVPANQVYMAPRCILLADDDDDDIYLFKRALNEIGAQCDLRIVKDGLETVRELSIPSPVEIVFLDLNMPLKSGIECLEDFGLVNGDGPAVVICLSTNYMYDIIAETSVLGARGYIAKPDDFEELKKALIDVFSIDWKSRAESDFYIYK